MPVAVTSGTSAARRLARSLPRPVRQGVRRAYHEVRSRLELLALRRRYRSRYGPGLSIAVHPRDEMFGFIHRSWRWRHHVAPMRAPCYALRTYLVSGDVMIRDLEVALADQGRHLAEVASFLEFACGYGRFTRFLVKRVEPARITVSDISADAVDHLRRAFGVDGFPSTAAAADLDHDRCYEVVFVASLFSHLAHEFWTDWLRRLYAMVAPGGLLVFSTHGPHARDVIYGERWRDRLETPEPGFSFLHTNETGGRLAVEYYGSTFVTEEYVAARIAEHGLGTLCRVYPAQLWGSQDLYVVERPARPR